MADRPGTLEVHDFPFDGGRRVSVFLPAERATAVVVAGDGAAVAPWGEDLVRTDLPPIAIVGVHGLADEQRRLAEYSPAIDPPVFAAYEAFIVDEVVAWARRRFALPEAAERTAAFGASAGGELAIALGIRHPDLFGAVLAGSPGAGYRPQASLPARLPRSYLVAGAREPFFLENAERWASALTKAGADVVLEVRDADHGEALWRAELPAMIRWAFVGP